MQLQSVLAHVSSHSVKMQVPQGHNKYMFLRGKHSSVLTSTQTNIIILLFMGLAGEVGLHYYDRKMMEQEVHCRHQLICKALQSCKTSIFHCSSLQRSEYEYPLASALYLVELSIKCNILLPKTSDLGKAQKKRGKERKKWKEENKICLCTRSLKNLSIL